MSLLTATIVGASFLGAALVVVLQVSSLRGRGAALLGVASAIATTALLGVLWISAPETLFWRQLWIPSADVGTGVYVDRLSLLFALLVVGINLLSQIYSVRSVPRELAVRGSSGEADYYGYMLLFTGAMLGMVFAADLVQLYLFWELTSVASFLLIGLNWVDPLSRRGAVRALLFTTLSGLAVLVGLLLMGSVVGSYALPVVLERGELVRTSPLFGVLLLLLLAGATGKSAQFPLHAWLPTAMVAPTPVSAFLHSAALVAAGVYLLLRFSPIFAGDPLWLWSVGGVGVASMLVGGVRALQVRTFKGILAYSTISQYGFLFTLIGIGGGSALGVAIFSFFQHGLIKAGLFFIAGIVTYTSGAREIGRSGDLGYRLPTVLAVAAALALSLGGLLPFSGFWMKEGYFGALLATGNLMLLTVAVAISALTLTYMLRFLLGAFFGGTSAPQPPESAPVGMLVAPGVLALLTLLFGLWPGLATSLLVEPAVQAVVGQSPDIDLSVHLDSKFLLSLLALGLGALAFVTYRRWSSLLDAVVEGVGSVDRLYGGATTFMIRFGQRLLCLQSGLLLRYLYLTLVSLAGLVAYAALPHASVLLRPPSAGDFLLEETVLVEVGMALLLLLVVVGTAITVVVRRHLHVVLALSAVGYLIGGVFALELAPDVGLVQVHVETLVTVLFVLALVLIPGPIRRPLALGVRGRLAPGKVILATVGGLGSGWLAWLAIEHPAVDPIAPWYNDHALELTHAGDVVAALLVDFRALDTLGEITVFAIAATGVFALMRLIRGEGE